jgi:hypothetical protein
MSATIASEVIIMFRIIAVSVRGPQYLIGNPSVHPINPTGQSDGPVPDGVGTTFATLSQARRYTHTQLGPISLCYQVLYCQVRVVDERGKQVIRGDRTGKQWAWTTPASDATSTDTGTASREAQ